MKKSRLASSSHAFCAQRALEAKVERSFPLLCEKRAFKWSSGSVARVPLPAGMSHTDLHARVNDNFVAEKERRRFLDEFASFVGTMGTDTVSSGEWRGVNRK